MLVRVDDKSCAGRHACGCKARICRWSREARTDPVDKKGTRSVVKYAVSVLPFVLRDQSARLSASGALYPPPPRNPPI